MPPGNEMTEYIGDGVYASFDGYHVWLDLRAQRSGDHVCRIALDPSVAESLVRYIDKTRSTHNRKREGGDDAG